jgi:hypothetical protein
MASNEDKVSKALAEITENHWFNPATMARQLSNEPIYTIDRLMELVAQIVHYQSQRYENEYQNGRTSEGLFLAKELNTQLKQLKKKYKFNNIHLPK